MKQTMCVRVLVLAACVCVGCASRQAAAPRWLGDVHSVYPRERYLSAVGSGTDRDAAQADALVQLARYMQTTVDSSLLVEYGTLSAGGTGGSIAAESAVARAESGSGRNGAGVGNSAGAGGAVETIVQRTMITAALQLGGIEYSSYYWVQAERLWYVAAYVPRDAVWEQYAPQLERARGPFAALYEQAQAADPVCAYFLYGQAQEAALPFMESLLLASTIDAPRATAQFAADREALAGLPAERAACLRQATVAVEVRGDSSGVVQAALEQALRQAGCTVPAESPRYRAVADVYLTAEQSERLDDGSTLYAAFPVCDVRLLHGADAVFQYSAAPGKVASYSTTRLTQNAMRMVADALRAEFAAAFAAGGSGL